MAVKCQTHIGSSANDWHKTSRLSTTAHLLTHPHGRSLHMHMVQYVWEPSCLFSTRTVFYWQVYPRLYPDRTEVNASIIPPGGDTQVSIKFHVPSREQNVGYYVHAGSSGYESTFCCRVSPHKTVPLLTQCLITVNFPSAGLSLIELRSYKVETHQYMMVKGTMGISPEITFGGLHSRPLCITGSISQSYGRGIRVLGSRLYCVPTRVTLA